MLYEVDGPLAEDDGSAWEFQPIGSRFTRVQVRPLSIALLRDGVRALSIGGDVVVDSALARELEHLVPGLSNVARQVIVLGPQPALQPLPDMVQLGALATVRLAPVCIERDPDGHIVRLVQPFVLDAASRAPDLSVCKIAENQLTLVSQAVRDLLLARQSGLSFNAVRFEDEAVPAEVPRAPFRMPSAEELRKLKGGS